MTDPGGEFRQSRTTGCPTPALSLVLSADISAFLAMLPEITIAVKRVTGCEDEISITAFQIAAF